LEERFTYDHLNRLTGIWLGNNRTGWMDYDAYGRMTLIAAIDVFYADKEEFVGE
jgi:YD repeat-containing protein